MKNRNLFFIILTCILLILPSLPITPIINRGSTNMEVTPSTKIEIDDVVVLNYTLWVDNKIQDKQNGTVWVHDPEDNKSPSELNETYSNIHVPPNIGFLEGILGMTVGQTRTFDVPRNKGFTNQSDPFYGEDLVYSVNIQRILYDASNPSKTLLDIPFFIPFILLIILAILTYISIKVYHFASYHDIFHLKMRCHICSKTAELKCGNEGCNTPYCKKCFINNNGCEICRSNKMIPLK